MRRLNPPPPYTFGERGLQVAPVVVVAAPFAAGPQLAVFDEAVVGGLGDAEVIHHLPGAHQFLGQRSGRGFGRSRRMGQCGGIVGNLFEQIQNGLGRFQQLLVFHDFLGFGLRYNARSNGIRFVPARKIRVMLSITDRYGLVNVPKLDRITVYTIDVIVGNGKGFMDMDKLLPRQ